MAFWAIVLVVALAGVRLMAPPLLRALREGEGSDHKKLRFGALAALAVTPLAAGLIYLQVGAPESLTEEFQAALQEPPPDQREAIAALPPEERAAVIENMVSGLAARLAEAPDDPDGWRMLARSYAILNRADESAAAYRELLARDENAGKEDWRNFALTLVAPDDGGEVVSGEARSAMRKLLSFDENEPLALFYLGMAAQQQGSNDEALLHWRKLKTVLPANAPILPQLQKLIDQAANVGVDGGADNDG